MFGRAQWCNRQPRPRLDQRERENIANDAESPPLVLLSLPWVCMCAVCGDPHGLDASALGRVCNRQCLGQCRDPAIGPLRVVGCAPVRPSQKAERGGTLAPPALLLLARGRRSPAFRERPGSPQMDFEVQAAGTLPAAALTARGPDHSIEFPQADPFETVLGDATGSTAAAAANRRQSPYSSVSGVLSGFISCSAAPERRSTRGTAHASTLPARCWPRGPPARRFRRYAGGRARTRSVYTLG